MKDEGRKTPLVRGLSSFVFHLIISSRRFEAAAQLVPVVATILLLSAVAGAADRRDGQWVWCAADRDRFVAAQRQRADLVPAVWVATIGWSESGVTMRLAHPPTFVRDAAAVALVVRFDDSAHRAWERDSARLATEVAIKLAWLLAETERLGVRPLEVQLDYDAPVRRLQAWAAVLQRLHDGPLAGRDVWITSLPSHMAQPAYGDWMRTAVSGHILQLFDTGIAPEDAEALARRTAAQRMPFRVGVGAFERASGAAHGVATRHGEWMAQLPLFARQPGFSGAWVFPGGMRWSPALLAGSE